MRRQDVKEAKREYMRKKKRREKDNKVEKARRRKWSQKKESWGYKGATI